ncbi:hypothetical protein Pan44_39820 [Caulifigura coniformis]|uniref:Uncharacterized protein n=1 Tax=Caulifigura coniformis TaxID=2527983 RepID=A0A517SIH9_9PLAN|nr:hypothetical protein [Caulifigura coniformis]QDT55934.1 hypothetical protein Pan44_39820 [Caulifigura coniformis]
MSARRKPSKNKICPSSTKTPAKSYAEVVARYLAEGKSIGDADLGWYARQPDYATLLDQAVMSRTQDDKRHPHQRRIPERVLRAAHRKLSNADLTSCESFDDLHDQIETATKSIDGIGVLAVFDFACRIGAWMKKMPTKVYLHAGTRAGARAMGLGRGRKTIEVKELPKEFHRLSGRHAEDCLCVYADDLARINGLS